MFRGGGVRGVGAVGVLGVTYEQRPECGRRNVCRLQCALYAPQMLPPEKERRGDPE